MPLLLVSCVAHRAPTLTVASVPWNGTLRIGPIDRVLPPESDTVASLAPDAALTREAEEPVDLVIWRMKVDQ